MEKFLLDTVTTLIWFFLAAYGVYITAWLFKARSLNKYYEALLESNNIEFALNKKTNVNTIKKEQFSLILTTMYDSYEIEGKKDMESFLAWYQNELDLAFILLPVKDGCFIIQRKIHERNICNPYLQRSNSCEFR